MKILKKFVYTVVHKCLNDGDLHEGMMNNVAVILFSLATA